MEETRCSKDEGKTAIGTAERSLDQDINDFMGVVEAFAVSILYLSFSFTIKGGR